MRRSDTRNLLQGEKGDRGRRGKRGRPGPQGPPGAVGDLGLPGWPVSESPWTGGDFLEGPRQGPVVGWGLKLRESEGSLIWTCMNRNKGVSIYLSI